MADGWEFRSWSSDDMPATAERTGEPQQVIVKVRSSGYVPQGFSLRTRVDDYLFTADADERAIDSAGRDPDVEAVRRSDRLRTQG